jgi:hypothetical protein
LALAGYSIVASAQQWPASSRATATATIVRRLPLLSSACQARASAGGARRPRSALSATLGPFLGLTPSEDSARTVYWIIDNGSSHAGNASIERMQQTWKNERLIHLPIHASWLNSENPIGCLAGV